MEIFQLISIANVAINIFSWHTLWLQLYSGGMSSGANLCSLYTWHSILNTMHGCFENSFTLITCNLNPAPERWKRNIGLSSKLNAPQIRTCVNLRSRCCAVGDSIVEKNQPGSFQGCARVCACMWFTLGSHMSHSCDKGWLIKAVIYYMRNIWIIMMWLDSRVLLFSAGWPPNLSGGTYATQERQRVTSFCRTVNPIMDSVCAFAIFGKCQQRR